jgi:GT2 family glycosyltransferase
MSIEISSINKSFFLKQTNDPERDKSPKQVLETFNKLHPRQQVSVSDRPRIQGKFIFAGDAKLYLRGVTYGTFEPKGAETLCEYDPQTVDKDFAAMAANGMNTVRVYTVPPRWVLDIAERHGLRMMIGMPWEQHINFLDKSETVKSIEARVREGVRTCANHPAVLCYSIGNEIPAAIVRWYGARRIEKFLHRLYKIVKSEDPKGLVTYVNFPSTEYLDLPFVDFVCFNVYLENQDKLDAYLARLQNIAGDRPLVMAEIGLDSIRNGLEKQAETLEWQIRTVFAAGCAGAFVFAWTDEWYRGGASIEDWDFGLTDRNRNPKPALETVRRAFSEIPFPTDMKYPRISVVVCSYNGSRTIRDCLEGLLNIDYPDFEVIVVNDGSTDNLAEIVQEYPFKLISTSNMGLSSARNTGMKAATGEIVAYTDDDARPDPQWLKYLAASFMKTTHAGIGGPNIAPAGDGEIAECVANAPGGPVHVLISDTEAEHIPGCNMAFRREALLAINGFDVQYRAAGDDVDLCWRIQEKGWTIGFSPAAMVWHHRRNSVLTYWKQQQGYGKAESLLEAKWPEKYNAAGHVTWTGRLYGKGLTETLNLKRGRIYQGSWGCAPFQAVYTPSAGLIESLPLMPEWYLIIGLLAMLSLQGIFWQPLLLTLPVLILAILAPIAQAILSGFKASFIIPPASRKQKLKMQLMTAMLHLMQPIARLKGRLKHGLTPWRQRGVSSFALPLPKTIVYWSENWRDSIDRLQSLENALRQNGAIVNRGGDFDNNWDLHVRGGMFSGTRLFAVSEEHGQNKQVIRLRVFPKISNFVLVLYVILFSIGLFAACSGAFLSAATIGVLAHAVAFRAVFEANYTTASILQAIENVRFAESGVLLEKSKILSIGSGLNLLSKETLAQENSPNRLAALQRVLKAEYRKSLFVNYFVPLIALIFRKQP